MLSNRRKFLGRTGLVGSAATIGLAGAATGQDRAADREDAAPRGGARHRIGVSTYSFWQFRGERLGIPECIDRAAAMGLIAVVVSRMCSTPEGVIVWFTRPSPRSARPSGSGAQRPKASSSGSR